MCYEPRESEQQCRCPDQQYKSRGNHDSVCFGWDVCIKALTLPCRIQAEAWRYQGRQFGCFSRVNLLQSEGAPLGRSAAVFTAAFVQLLMACWELQLGRPRHQPQTRPPSGRLSSAACGCQDCQESRCHCESYKQQAVGHCACPCSMYSTASMVCIGTLRANAQSTAAACMWL